MNEQDIFIAAMEQDPGERQQFLDEACAGDDPLRKRVEHLLQQSDQVGSFLDHPPLEANSNILDGISPTLVFGNGSTCDDEGKAIFSEEPDMRQNPPDEDDEIPLGYLEPPTREDSLGRLGHYEVLNVIGKGAFGTVLRAFDTKLERIVAIKVLALEMACMSPARKRFLREARTSAQIRHENVVGIYSVEEEPIPYLVMEYIPGKTLQQQLQEHGPLDIPSVLRLGKQIADGLAAAHAQDLIHRDIKPGNILLEGGVTERVKITDFGLARTADDSSMTQSGLIAGTPMYMAPEQVMGHKLDQRADLFSFGSVLYQMLCGRPPFRAANTVAVLKRVVDDRPRPIQEIIPEVPTWMCELVSHLHAKNPDDRYQSAKEVSDVLGQCLDDLKAGRVPKLRSPSPSAMAATEHTPALASQSDQAHGDGTRRGNPLVKIAAAAMVLLAVLGITEATGVTKLAATVIRLTTGSGTLVIEADDGVKIAINGEEVTITGGGGEELTLRPGDYEITATKDGKPVKQELVSITRNGRRVVRMSLEPAAATASPTGGLGKELPPTFTNTIGMEFVRVPKGKSWLGGGKDKLGDKEVEIPADFYLGKYEVSQEEWEKVMGENPSHFSRMGEGKDAVKDIPDADLKRFPVETVDWDRCQIFVAKLNQLERQSGWIYRLPMLDEWEYACRGGPMTFANKIDSASDFYFARPTNTLHTTLANFSNGGTPEDPVGLRRTCRVGSYRPNTLGLFDMPGNVEEWCADNDKIGADGKPLRVFRGGSYKFTPLFCAARASINGWTHSRFSDLGLRLARVPVGVPSVDAVKQRPSAPPAAPSEESPVKNDAK